MRAAIWGGGAAIVLVAAAALVLRAEQRAEAARAAMRDSFIDQALLLPRGSRESVAMALKGLSSPPTPKEMRVVGTLTHAARRFAEEVVVEAERDIIDATWSADGKRIAVVSDDSVLRIVDAATGKAIAKAETSGPGELVRWADDALVVAHKGGIELYTSDAGKRLDQEGSLPHPFVRITPDGRHVAFADARTAKVFTVKGSKLASRDLPDRQKTSTIALSDDGELLARDGEVTNARGERVLSVESPVIGFSPSGALALVGVRTGAEIWDLGRRGMTWSMYGTGKGGVFSRDGLRIYASDAVVTARFASSNGERVLWRSHAKHDYGAPMPTSEVIDVVAPDGKRLAVSRVDGTCEIRDAETGDVLDVVVGRPLSFSPDGARLLTKSGRELVAWRVGGAGLEQHLLDWEKEPEFREGTDYASHTRPPRVHWIFDGHRPVRLEGFHRLPEPPVVHEHVVLAITHVGETDEAHLVIWSRFTGQQQRDVPIEKSSRGSNLAREVPRAVICHEGACSVVDDKGDVLRKLDAGGLESGISPDGRHVAVRYGDAWKVIDVATGKVDGSIPYQRGDLVNFTNQRVLFGLERTRLFRFDGKLLQSADGPLELLTRDGRVFTTFTNESLVSYDTDTGKPMGSCSPSESMGEPMKLAGVPSPRGDQWLVRRDATLWNPRSCERELVIPPGVGISRYAFSEAGEWLVTVDAKPRSGLEWNLRTWTSGDERIELPITTDGPWNMELQVSDDGRYVIAGSPPTLFDVSWPAIQAAASRIVASAGP